MVNIYIVTSDTLIYDKLDKALSKTSYMDIASYQLDSVDSLIDRIDSHQDVDVALITEDIINLVSYNRIDDQIVKSRNVPYLIVNTSKKILMEAIHSNAQDIILIHNLDIDRAVWSILHSLERNKMINRLYENSIEDALTGLYNRRGFLTLAKDTIRLMDDSDYHIIFIDMDKMKQINDKNGHEVGDAALKEAADILNTSFREGDIISRYGGDEFVVLVAGVGDDVINNIKIRIQKKIDFFNSNKKHKYQLGLTLGHAKYIQGSDETLQKVINRADKDMYDRKIKL